MRSTTAASAGGAGVDVVVAAVDVGAEVAALATSTEGNTEGNTKGATMGATKGSAEATGVSVVALAGGAGGRPLQDAVGFGLLACLQSTVYRPLAGRGAGLTAALEATSTDSNGGTGCAGFAWPASRSMPPSASSV